MTRTLSEMELLLIDGICTRLGIPDKNMLVAVMQFESNLDPQAVKDRKSVV